MVRYARVRLTLVTTERAAAEASNQEFAAQLGVEHRFIPLREEGVASGVSGALMDKYYYLGERLCAEQRHIDIQLGELIADLSPDLIIVNGITVALCIPVAFSSIVPCCFITHNRETDIHRDFRRYALDAPGTASFRERLMRTLTRHCNMVSNYRFAHYMRQLYRQCAGVIALVPYDLPNGIPKNVKSMVVAPLIRKRDQRWTYRGTRSLLFVGNANYFANRLAIEWLRDQLAPELLLLDSRVAINIIGAGHELASRKRNPNINFLGVADKNEVIRRMTSEDLLVVPTAQRYGAKLKLAEAAAHGMPFIASASAMGGLPFLGFMPQIALSAPAAAAHLILHHMDNPTLLVELSQRMVESLAQASRRQALQWAPFIRSMLRRELASTDAEEVEAAS